MSAEKESRLEDRGAGKKSFPVWAVPAAFVAVIAAVCAIVIPGMLKKGDGEEESGGGMSYIANPYVEVGDASEFESRLGIRLTEPEGAGDAVYNLVAGKMADIRFSYAGHEYCLRAQKDGGDISGLYGTELKTVALGGDGGAVLTVIGSGDERYLKISWTADGVSYVLLSTDGVSEDEITAVFGKIG